MNLSGTLDGTLLSSERLNCGLGVSHVEGGANQSNAEADKKQDIAGYQVESKIDCQH